MKLKPRCQYTNKRNNSQDYMELVYVVVVLQTPRHNFGRVVKHCNRSSPIFSSVFQVNCQDSISSRTQIFIFKLLPNSSVIKHSTIPCYTGGVTEREIE